MVGGPELTDPRDCLVYLVAGSRARVLIDAGAGPSAAGLLEAARLAAGRDPSHLFLTHVHIDHAGGAAEIKRRTGCQVLIHQGDALALAGGDPRRSAADWYGLDLPPVEPDLVLSGPGELDLGSGQALHLLPTPGHTPGSMVAWGDLDGRRILFGQDIHGPFDPAFGSDLAAWAGSMERLLALEADLLAEGHFGLIHPARRVRSFILDQLASYGFTPPAPGQGDSTHG